MTMPAALAEVVSEFSEMQGQDKLALLLALAESLDYTETSQIHVIEPSISKKNATLKLYAQGIPSIEMHQIQEHLSWFKKTFGVELKVQLATAAEE